MNNFLGTDFLMFEESGSTYNVFAGASSHSFEISGDILDAPSKDAVNKIRTESERINSEVSETDIKLLGLAKEKEGILVTDDYHMQNLAEKMGISWKGFEKDGIEEEFEWKKVCRDCGRTIESDKCPFCGGKAEIRSN